MNGLILLALAIVPVEDVAEERCDSIECNSFYDDQYRLVFDQLLFRDWNPSTGQFDIRAWRLRKSDFWHTPLPENGEYMVTFFDGDKMRSIRAPVRVVSGYQVDQELVERRWLPKEVRRELVQTTRKSRVRGR